MSDKFKITLLASKTALAELIATGLEKHAVITGIEAVPAPVEQKPVADDPVVLPVQRKPHLATHKKPPATPVRAKPPQLQSEEVYRVICNRYQPGEEFRVNDVTHWINSALDDQFKKQERDRVSAHFTRFHSIGVIERISGNAHAGYAYRYNEQVSNEELMKRIKKLGEEQTANRRVKTAQRKNGWFNNLNTGSRRLNG